MKTNKKTKDEEIIGVKNMIKSISYEMLATDDVDEFIWLNKRLNLYYEVLYNLKSKED